MAAAEGVIEGVEVIAAAAEGEVLCSPSRRAFSAMVSAAACHQDEEHPVQAWGAMMLLARWCARPCSTAGTGTAAVVVVAAAAAAAAAGAGVGGEPA